MRLEFDSQSDGLHCVRLKFSDGFLNIALLSCSLMEIEVEMNRDGAFGPKYNSFGSDHRTENVGLISKLYAP
jgi:hypothetical protein